MLSGTAELIVRRALLLPFGLLIFVPLITSALASVTGSGTYDVSYLPPLTVMVVLLLSVVNLMYDICICSIFGHCGRRAEVGIRGGKRLAGLRELTVASELTRNPRGIGGSLSNFSSTGTESRGRLSFLVACYGRPMVLRRF
jgi:hypothetical protein